MKKHLRKPLWFVYVVIASFLLLTACRQTPATPSPTTAVSQPTAPATAAIPTATAEIQPVTPMPPVAELPEVELRFATFRETAVQIGPGLTHEPIAPDLSNVRIAYLLSPEQRARLGQDGLVVAPGTEKEFFTVYEQARYANAPLFVTSDSVLHVYHLLFNKTLRTAERE
jgi:hypothetical protein